MNTSSILHGSRRTGGTAALLACLLCAPAAWSQFPGFGGGGGNAGGRGSGNTAAASGVMQAAQQVAVVADEYSNSLIILAPDIYQEAISNLVRQLDVPVQDITELRVFALQNADPTEMAQVLNSLFPDQTTASTGGGNRGGGFQFGGRNNQQTTAGTSERAKQQSKVLAVADPRTSSVLVSASKDLMEQIAPMIAQLDASTSKKQKVFVYSLENADSTEVETVLRNLFEGQNTRNTRTGTQNNQQNNALQQRQNNAARTQGTGTATGFGGGGGLGTGTGTGR
jgi:type II secretory pathway component GspD/PulD (secretin)